MISRLWARLAASFVGNVELIVLGLIGLLAVVARSRSDGRELERARAQRGDVRRANEIRDAVDRLRRTERLRDVGDTRGYRD